MMRNLDAAAGGARATPDARVESVMADLPGVVWEADADDYRMLFVSSTARELLGHDPGEWVGIPGFWEAHIHPEDRDAAIAAADRVVSAGGRGQIQYRFRHADGEFRQVLDTMRLVAVPDGGMRLSGVMVILDAGRTPGSPEAATGPAAPGASPLHEAIVHNLGDGVYYVDTERRITYWNRGAERLTGYRANEVVGRACHDNLLCHVDADGRNLCQTGCPLMATMEGNVPQEAIVWLRHADGSRRPVHVRTAPILSAAQEVIGGVEIFSDATGLVEAQSAAAAARRDALTDPLTGLANRRLLDTVLAARQEDLDRLGFGYGFLLVDIDHFKRVNDDHGHDVGDVALRLVAETIRGTVRSGDVVARWGGEEFAVVLAADDAPAVLRLAERIRRIVRSSAVPVADGRSLPVRVSVGAALARRNEPAAALFARADRALLTAKGTGRDRVVLEDAGTLAGPLVPPASDT